MTPKIITLSWFLIVTVVSLVPVPKGVSTMVSDKFIHFIIYYISTFLCFLIPKERSLNKLLKISIYIFIYGITIELLQYLIPGRSFSIEDIFANTTGIYLFIVSYILLSKNQKKWEGNHNTK